MAITYKKPLKTIKVYVKGIDTPIEVADTVSAPNASTALAEFERGQKMHLVLDGKTDIVPYGSVAYVEVTSSESDAITKEDPYCVDADVSE